MMEKAELLEVPEAWDLHRVRATVQAVADGADLAEAIELTPRHVGYHCQAARILGWLARADGSHRVTHEGKQLLTLAPSSEDERDFMRQSIATCPLVREVVPLLLEGATQQQLERQLAEHPLTHLALATARKRASALIKWRDHVQSAEPGANKPCQRLLIVHLSDIHFRTTKEDNPVLTRTEAIASAIAARPEVCIGIHACCIVLSGDIAWSGETSQYELANLFIVMLRDALQARLSVEPLVFICAGNHDCHFKPEDSVRDTLLEHVKPNSLDAGYVEQCSEVQREFRDFSAKWNKSEHRTITHFPALDVHDVKFGDRAIRFQLFNTAWMSSRQEKQGQLVFPKESMEQVRLPPTPAPAVVVSAFHHPYSWLESNNARDFRATIEATSDIVLTGHEHVSDRYTKVRPHGQQSEFIEGNVLQEHTTPDRSGFNILLLDLEREEQSAFSLQWSGGKLYELSQTYPTIPFQRNQFRLRNEFAISREYLQVISEPGEPYQHPRKRDIRLSDIFVYPELCETELQRPGLSADKITENAFAFLQKERYVLVLGGELSGKTSLSKTLFLDFQHRGLVTVLLKGKDLVDAQPIKIHEVITAQFSDTFSPGLVERYRQLPGEQRAIIIDDLHQSPLNLKHRDAVLDALRKFADYVIVFASSELEFEALKMLPTDAALWEFTHAQILEFGHRKRYELINRWCSLGLGQDADLEALSKETARKDGTITRLIGDNLLPSWPSLILLCLQQLESQSRIDKELGSFGHLYEALLTRSLLQSASAASPVDLDAKHQFLSELAFHVYSASASSLDEHEFDERFRAYCEKFHVGYSRDRVEKELLASGILHRRHGRISFKYKYAYFFFVAKYLRDHIEGPSIQEIIRSLAARLYHEDGANILLFLCHLTRHSFVIDTLLETASGLFANEEPLELHKAFAPLAVPTELPSLQLHDGDHEKNRLHERKQRDHFERSDEHAQDAPTEQLPPELMQFTASFKTIQILGQVLKGFPGSIPGDRKLKIALECYSLCARASNGFVSSLVRHRDEFESLLTEIVLRRKPKLAQKPEELHRAVGRLLFGVCEAICFGVIVHTSDAVGLQTLSRTYDEAIKGDAPVLYRLVDLAIRLDHFDQFPETQFKSLHEDMRDKVVPTSLMRRLVWRHFRLFPVSFNVRNRVCARLGIKVPLSLTPRRMRS